MEPEWIVHPNGALGMMAIHAVADDPQETAKALGEAWSAMTEDIFDGCVDGEDRRGRAADLVAGRLSGRIQGVEAMAPEHKPAIVGIAIAVERARPLQALLRANNVPFALTEGDRVIVPAEQADGLMIEFMPQNG